MPKYIALLRGINVGGKNKVPMPQLKALFEQGGFFGVTTYINSGNVIFESDVTDTAELKARCERLLADAFPFHIPVIVLSGKDVVEALSNAPAWWHADQDATHNAIFVIPPVTVEEVYAQVGEPKPEYEQVAHYGRVIFWSAPRKTFSRTRWSKIVQTSVYSDITIRNANTAKKLAELAKDFD